MQKSMRIVMALALVGFVAACAKKAEEEGAKKGGKGAAKGG